MKIFINMLSFLLIVFVTLLVVFLKIDAQNEYWRKWGEKEGLNSTIYLHFNSKSDEEIYNSLLFSCQKNKVNAIKTDFISSGENKIISKSLVLGNESINMFSHDKLLQGDFSKFKDKDSDTFVSSNKDKKGSCGKLFDFLDINNVEIGTLKHLLNNKQSLKGDYTIKYQFPENFNNFLKDLSEKLGVKEEEMTSKNHDSFYYSSKFSSLVYSAIFIILLMFLFGVIFYFFKKTKNVGVAKLFGYSDTKIFLELFKSPFLISLITSIFIDFFVIFFLKSIDKNFIDNLIIGQVIGLLLIFLAAIPAWFYTKRSKLKDLIYNKSLDKSVFRLMFFIKQILILSLIVASCFLPSMIKEMSESQKELSNLQESSDQIVLNSQSIGEDLSRITSSSPNFAYKSEKLYDFFVKNYDSLYVKFDSLNLFRFKKNFDREKKISSILVNPNFLNKYKINDLNGNRITVSENEENRVILTPKSSEFKEQDAKELFLNKFIDDINSTKRRYKLDDYGKPVSVKVIFYDDSDSNFSFLKNQNTLPKKISEEPLYIEVSPSNLMTLSEKEEICGPYGIENPLRIDFKGKSSEEFSKEISQKLEEFGLSKNNLIYKKLGEIFQNKIHDLENNIKTIILVLVLLVLIIVLLSAQSSKFYIETYKKEIAVKKINGYEIFGRYKTYAITLSVFFFVNIFVVLIFSSIVNSSDIVQSGIVARFEILDSMIVCFSVALFDMFVSYLIIKFYDFRKIPAILKGA